MHGRDSLGILCCFRPALRLFYLGNVDLRGHFFCYPAAPSDNSYHHTLFMAVLTTEKQYPNCNPCLRLAGLLIFDTFNVGSLDGLIRLDIRVLLKHLRNLLEGAVLRTIRQKGLVGREAREHTLVSGNMKNTVRRTMPSHTQ